MCRHLAFLGTRPRSLAALLLYPAHGLLVQSYAPRQQRHGRINADGWGVGFFAEAQAEPARWRSARPLWADASFASVAPVLYSRCVVAAVRSASPGMPLDETAVAPFQSGRWLLSHNGLVDREVLGPQPTAESMCDSAQLAALVFALGAEHAGAIVAKLGQRDRSARLNLLLVSGDRIIATRWNDTLSILSADDGVIVASEPYDDDPRWTEVPDHHLVDVTGGGVSITDLEA